MEKRFWRISAQINFCCLLCERIFLAKFIFLLNPLSLGEQCFLVFNLWPNGIHICTMDDQNPKVWIPKSKRPNTYWNQSYFSTTYLNVWNLNSLGINTVYILAQLWLYRDKFRLYCREFRFQTSVLNPNWSDLSEIRTSLDFGASL